MSLDDHCKKVMPRESDCGNASRKVPKNSKIVQVFRKCGNHNLNIHFPNAYCISD